MEEKGTNNRMVTTITLVQTYIVSIIKCVEQICVYIYPVQKADEMKIDIHNFGLHILG